MKKKKVIKKQEKKDSSRRTSFANVKVVGIGGGGSNAVSRISHDFVRGVDFIAINTDHQDLDYAGVRNKIYIGRNLTRGLGTGMNPDLGRQAAEENRSEIAEHLRDADLIFITAGMGGGTGTGASPVVAEVAKQTGALTIAVVTKPFAFEGSQRARIAQEGLMKLKDKVDALIVVPNDRVFSIIGKDTPIVKAFETIDDVLRSAFAGIVELIVTPGLVNVDYADIRSVVQDAGSAIIGVGLASGPERAVQAVHQAMNSPLLEVGAEGAKGVVLGISGGRDMRMNEINEAAKILSQAVDPSARIIFGAYYDRRLKPNQIKVTLIATGFNGASSPSSLFGRAEGPLKQEFFGGTRSSVVDETRVIKEDAPTNFAGKQTAKLTDVPGAVSVSKERSEREEIKKKEKDSDSDIWEIPTFLRKKKR